MSVDFYRTSRGFDKTVIDTTSLSTRHRTAPACNRYQNDVSQYYAVLSQHCTSMSVPDTA
eukprot:1351797-Rhodomonas_salina.2